MNRIISYRSVEEPAERDGGRRARDVSLLDVGRNRSRLSKLVASSTAATGDASLTHPRSKVSFDRCGVARSPPPAAMPRGLPKHDRQPAAVSNPTTQWAISALRCLV